MPGLKVLATARRNTNVLQHVLGYFKKLLDAEARAELLGLIGDYHKGLVPLVVPVTLIRHHVRTHGVAYLAARPTSSRTQGAHAPATSEPDRRRHPEEEATGSVALGGVPSAFTRHREERSDEASHLT
jgi:hypothetical protein